MDTTLTIDLGVMLAAVAPTIGVIYVAWSARRTAKAADNKLVGIHTLVNDQLTRVKQTHLNSLMANKLIIEQLAGSTPTVAEQAIIAQMAQDILVLSSEIERRDAAAESLTDAQR